METQAQGKSEASGTQQHIAQYQTVHHHHYYSGKKSLKDIDISYRHEDDENNAECTYDYNINKYVTYNLEDIGFTDLNSNYIFSADDEIKYSKYIYNSYNVNNLYDLIKFEFSLISLSHSLFQFNTDNNRMKKINK